ALVVDVVAAAELALHVRGRVGRDVGAALVAGDVEELGFLTISRRPEIRAAVHVRASALEDVSAALPRQREVLHVLAGIVVDWLTGLGIDALGPGHLGGILDGL